MPPKNRTEVQDLAAIAAAQVRVDTGFREVFASGRTAKNIGLVDFAGLSETVAKAQGSVEIKQANQEFDAAFASTLVDDGVDVTAELAKFKNSTNQKVSGGTELGIRSPWGQKGRRKALGIRAAQEASKSAEQAYDEYTRGLEPLAERGELPANLKQIEDFLAESYDPLFGDADDLISRDDLFTVQGFSEERGRTDERIVKNGGTRMDALLDLDHVIKTRDAIADTLFRAATTVNEEDRKQGFKDASLLVNEGVAGTMGRQGPVAGAAMEGLRAGIAQIMAQPGIDKFEKTKQVLSMFEIAGQSVGNTSWRKYDGFEVLHGQYLAQHETATEDRLRNRVARNNAELSIWKDEEGGAYQDFLFNMDDDDRLHYLANANRGETSLSRLQVEALNDAARTIENNEAFSDHQLKQKATEYTVNGEFGLALELAALSSQPEAERRRILDAKESKADEYITATISSPAYASTSARFEEAASNNNKMHRPNDGALLDMSGARQDLFDQYSEDVVSETDPDKRAELKEQYHIDDAAITQAFSDSTENSILQAGKAFQKANESLDNIELVDLDSLGGVLTIPQHREIKARQTELDRILTITRGADLKESEAMNIVQAGDTDNFDTFDTGLGVESRLTNKGKVEFNRVLSVIDEGAGDIMDSEEFKSNIRLMPQGEFTDWFRGKLRVLVSDVDTGEFLGEEGEAAAEAKAKEDEANQSVEEKRQTALSPEGLASIWVKERSERYNNSAEMRGIVENAVASTDPLASLESILSEDVTTVTDGRWEQLRGSEFGLGLAVDLEPNFRTKVNQMTYPGTESNSQLRRSLGVNKGGPVSSPLLDAMARPDASKDALFNDVISLNALYRSVADKDRLETPGAQMHIRGERLDARRNRANYSSSPMVDDRTGKAVPIEDLPKPNAYDTLMARIDVAREDSLGLLAAIPRNTQGREQAAMVVVRQTWVDVGDVVAKKLSGVNVRITNPADTLNPRDTRYFRDQAQFDNWASTNLTFDYAANTVKVNPGSEAEKLLGVLETWEIEDFLSAQEAQL